jgi:hypothetical protein
MAECCSEQEERPAQFGGEPECAPYPNAQEFEDPPRTVVDSVELERTSRRPVDLPRDLVGEETVRDETEDESHDSDIEHESIKQKQAEDGGSRLRLSAGEHVQAAG